MFSVALYGRYSSDQQREASIEDLLRLWRASTCFRTRLVPLWICPIRPKGFC
jgi:hypothetical protein